MMGSEHQVRPSIDSKVVRMALNEALSLLGEEGREIVLEYIDPPIFPNSKEAQAPLTEEEVEYALRRFFGANAESIVDLFKIYLSDLAVLPSSRQHDSLQQ